MPTLLRGQIYLADLDPVRGHEQAGIRPVLVLSSTQSNNRARLAIILPITASQPRVAAPYAVPLRSVAMEKDSWVLTRQVRTISDERILSYIGRVSNEEMQEVVAATIFHIIPPGSDIAVADYPGLAPAGPAAV